MEFELTNGTGRISTYDSDMGCYFQYNETPLSVFWPNLDWEDETKSYFSNLPHSKEYRKQVSDSLDLNFECDFSNDLSSLFNKLDPLIGLLENGSYQLSVSNNLAQILVPKAFPPGSGEKLGFDHWYLEVTDSPKITSETPRTWYMDDTFPVNKVSESTHQFDDDGGLHLLSTVSRKDIDQERVRYFEKAIAEGKRPAAILFQYFDMEGEPIAYVLDGHCKLSAYSNLQQMPHVLLLTQKRKQTGGPKLFPIEKFIDVLYPWQIRYIIKYNVNLYLTVQKNAKEGESQLHRFLKNGAIKSYFPSGKLKHKAFYINDKIEGVATYWHENGKLCRKWNYKEGRLFGKCKDYNTKGKLERIHSYGSKGQFLGSEEKRGSELWEAENEEYLFGKASYGTKKNWKKGLKIALIIILTLLLCLNFLSRIIGL